MVLNTDTTFNSMDGGLVLIKDSNGAHSLTVNTSGTTTTFNVDGGQYIGQPIRVNGETFGFMALEMCLWDKPLGLKIFGQTPERAQASKVLAANQGLYNGFLAAGLVWGLVAPSGGTAIMTFFLCCVFVAGVFGALTVNSRIFYVQAAPATLGLALLWL